jgi:hypothetical protein|nr:hypothetical protein [Luteibacter rhizovicinus]
MDLIIEGDFLPGLPEILSAMRTNGADFMWHLADVEASTWPQHIDDCWIAGSDLMSTWVPNETQFIWGVLDAFPDGRTSEIGERPYADGNQSFWTGEPLTPQLDGAAFEIVYWDSDSVLLIGLTAEQTASVLAEMPRAKYLSSLNE